MLYTVITKTIQIAILITIAPSSQVILYGDLSSEAVKMLLELQEKLAAMKDLRETISKNVGRVLPDKPLTISCSIGVTESTRNGMRFSEAEILKKADEALYIVKKGNRKGTLMEL